MNRYESLDRLIVEIRNDLDSGSSRPVKDAQPGRFVRIVGLILALLALYGAFHSHYAIAGSLGALALASWCVARWLNLSNFAPSVVYLGAPTRAGRPYSVAVTRTTSQSDRGVSISVVEAMARDRLGLVGEVPCEAYEMESGIYHVVGEGTQETTGTDFQFMAAVALDESDDGRVECESLGLVWH